MLIGSDAHSDCNHELISRTSALSRRQQVAIGARRAPVDTVDQHRQLFRAQRQRLTRLDVRRPQEDALLERMTDGYPTSWLDDLLPWNWEKIPVNQ